MLAMIAPDGLVVWLASNAGASRAAAPPCLDEPLPEGAPKGATLMRLILACNGGEMSVGDLHATVLTAVGIDPRKLNQTPIGRTVRFSEGTPVAGLLGKS